jgi:hypothetical protein
MTWRYSSSGRELYRPDTEGLEVEDIKAMIDALIEDLIARVQRDTQIELNEGDA